MPVARMILFIFVDVLERDDVLEAWTRARAGSSASAPSRSREKMAPATKYGGKIVVCQPGISDAAKSNDTIEWTESTSGVERPARIR